MSGVAIVGSITEALTREGAREALAGAIAVLEKRNPKLAAFLEGRSEEILAVYQLPPEHRRRVTCWRGGIRRSRGGRG